MIEKLAIIITELRQIDYYMNIVNSIGPKNVEFIVKNSIARSLSVSNKNKKIHGVKISNLKNVLSEGIQYRYVLSTGNFKLKIPFQKKSLIYLPIKILKFIYARTIGHFFYISGVSSYFEKNFGRPFDAGAKNCRLDLVERIHPELLIGHTNILYPRGLDINPKIHPNKGLQKIFDVFLCHGLYDFSIMKQNTNKEIKIIGYPRYDTPKSEEEARNDLKKKFNLADNRPIGLWMPSRVDWLRQPDQNILDWMPSIMPLLDTGNIILRLHPHIAASYPCLIKKAVKIGFKIDAAEARKLVNLYSGVDYVLCDYGGSIFSSIYMSKKIFLLNARSEHAVSHINDLDLKIRPELDQYTIEEGNLVKDVNYFLSHQGPQITHKERRIKSKLFGNFNQTYLIDDFKNFLAFNDIDKR